MEPGKMDTCLNPTSCEVTKSPYTEGLEPTGNELRLRLENQRLRRLLDLQNRDWQLVGYEIHDGIAQQLAGALMHFQAFEAGRAEPARLDWNAFSHALEQLCDGIHETRQFVASLRPIGLDQDLWTAIRNLADRTHADCGLTVELSAAADLPPLDLSLQHHLFRIVQEGVANVRRHSQSDRVQVAMGREDDELYLSIQDWGVGFSSKEIREGHFGLEGIRRRAESFGGRLTIASLPGKGTRIEVRLPWQE